MTINITATTLQKYWCVETKQWPVGSGVGTWDGFWRIVFRSFDSHQSGHTSYTHEMRDTVLSFDPYQIDHHLDWNRTQFVNSLFILNILFLMRGGDIWWSTNTNDDMARILVTAARHCVTPGLRCTEDAATRPGRVVLWPNFRDRGLGII